MTATVAIAPSKVGRVRFAILAVIFAITVVNYGDRAAMSIAAPRMSADLGLSSISLGFVFSAFAWSYVLAQLPSGLLLDRFGTKWVYGAGIALWSLFTALQGTAGFFTGAAAVGLLFALQLLVGLAEAPSFPANARVVSMWFPTSERGFASAVFNSGQYFAPVLFTPLMAWIVDDFGWQEVFGVMGALGVLVAILWARSFSSPRRQSRVSQRELDYLVSGGALVDVDENLGEEARQRARPGVIKELLKNRTLVGIYVAQYCVVTLTYFFLTWFPVYLVKARGLTILQAGFVATLPAMCGFVGGILGGIISDYIMRRTGSLTIARKTPIIGGMLLSTVIVACNYATASWMVVVFMALAFFGKGVGSLGWAVVADTSPKESPGVSAGLFNTFGNVAGITTPIAIGYIVALSHGSFSGALTFVSLNALIALLSYLFVVGKIERIELTQSA